MRISDIYSIYKDKNKNFDSGQSELLVIITAVVFICIGAVFIIVPWRFYLNTNKILNQGGRVAAEITDKSKVRQRRTGNDTRQNYDIIHYVSYRFKIKNKEIENRGTVDESTWYHLKIGSKVEVAYDLETPGNNFIVNGEGFSASLLFLCMPVFFSLLGLLTLFLGGKFLIGVLK
uniref:DUF3592 domain-containing protein n=1 Tax=Candidatus Electrothrix sp. TaxID=2170559 RepID=UPI0040579FA6